MFLVNPAKDSATVNNSSYPVSIKCYDPSGLAIVKCLKGADTFAVTKTDSIYTATVTGLTQGTYSTIMFIATDASTAGNKDTLSVHIKYDSTIVDSIPPIMKLVTPSKDSSSVSTNTYSISVVSG
jgi:hypothetical protein